MGEVLNPRLAELLIQSVEDYIKFAAPVTSIMLSGKSSNNFSSATIRNDLKILEQCGYLRQVHTSGGRVPTTLGYKAYIDNVQSGSFVGDLVNDLYTLASLADRIDRKIHGSTGEKSIKPVRAENLLERRQNIHRLLEIPNVEMSALYLIIKERMNGRK